MWPDCLKCHHPWHRFHHDMLHAGRACGSSQPAPLLASSTSLLSRSPSHSLPFRFLACGTRHPPPVPKTPQLPSCSFACGPYTHCCVQLSPSFCTPAGATAACASPSQAMPVPLSSPLSLLAGHGNTATRLPIRSGLSVFSRRNVVSLSQPPKVGGCSLAMVLATAATCWLLQATSWPPVATSYQQ